jgi:Na+-driven multidrug efflux pump
MGLIGAAFATLISTLITLILTFIYAVRIPELKDAWFLPNERII